MSSPSHACLPGCRCLWQPILLPCSIYTSLQYISYIYNIKATSSRAIVFFIQHRLITTVPYNFDNLTVHLLQRGI
ncbi:hypothetical protein BO83DRAFT_433945 [Aspergillus eucalypticola CBS 122712]|uniref:Uncharacterized protein n=1 Tax=Aspergillus eucalypticola (strain CBS 122712 / IBT 29274) TaxID=1448314 RepID=A0A317WFE5_ASPEC|nr:uncharacterized protein BO83DRAFT_433945 [Aspergillus eucalypticola CBS 122712]PWY84411.1 hypothetical protein BO83DRAFT_433945 [Aspergillus eucalypticola CBS 122712]